MNISFFLKLIEKHLSFFKVNSRIFEFEGDFIKLYSSHQYLVNPLTCGNQGKKLITMRHLKHYLIKC